MTGDMDVKLTKTRIRAGVWEGVLSGAGQAPQIEALHLDRPVPGLRLTALPDAPGQFALHLPIPVDVLHDGVQGFLIRDAASGETLAHFAVATGAMDDDLRAEVDLLRAELDLLKRAFRRHCLETAG